MARKKLNKKVAIIGLAAIAVLILVLIAVILRFSRSPDKFIRDGEKALASKDYEQAEAAYKKAFGRARTDELKIEILFSLVDVYQSKQDWKMIMNCWERIAQIRPSEYHARLESLNFYYVLADSDMVGYWQKVGSLAQEFLDNVNKSVYSEKIPELKSADRREKPIAGCIGCYIYLLKGRANYEMARLGMTIDLEVMYNQAIEDLKTAQAIEPGNVNVYQHLAQATVLRGNYLDLRGNLQAKENARKEATQILEEGLAKSEDGMHAEMNILNMKLVYADEKGPDAVKQLEPEFLAFMNKYSSSAEAHRKMADFYLLTGPKNIDKAVVSIEKAMELDKDSILYKIVASTMYYYQFGIGGRKSFDTFKKSIEIAQRATELPDAQDIQGPYNWRNLKNKHILNAILASRYVEQILERYQPISETEKKELVAKVEEAVHNIEQIVGSGQSPDVAMWKGMLELVTGDKTSAIKKLFSIYEQSTSPDKSVGVNAQLSYILAKEYMKTTEQGAVYQFLSNALKAGIARWSRPEAVLEFCEVLMKLDLWSQSVATIDTYEQLFGANQKSQTLRIEAYIGAEDYEKASKYLEQEPKNSAETLKLKITLDQAKVRGTEAMLVQDRIEQTSSGVFSDTALKSQKEEYLRTQLKGYREALAQDAKELLALNSGSYEDAYISAVCENYLEEGQIDKGREYVESVLKKLPENSTARFYKNLLSEPQPEKTTSQRRMEIEEQVLKGISDSLERSMNLGMFYKNKNDFAKAKEQFTLAIGNYFNEQDKLSDLANEDKVISRKKIAVENLFGIALQTKDWDLASKISDAAKAKNLDKCQGLFYAARMAAAQKEPQSLDLFNETIQQRPVFSYAYLYRSNVYAAMGNEQAAIEDAEKAALYNPLDGTIAKNLASMLYSRNQKLGNSVTPGQKDELAAALDVAMSVNNGDLDLFSFYAEFISNIDSKKALAIRQYLFGVNPTVENAYLLGRMATKMASEQTDATRKERLFKVAEEAFKKGKQIDPANIQVVYGYSQLYKAMGLQQEAERVVQEAKDPYVLWAYYYDAGQYDQAKSVLEQLRQANPKDTKALKGFVLVSEKTANKEDADKYSSELLAIEDNIDNRILQIKVFVNVGLIEEAEKKLQSFREKYPDEPRAKYIRAWISMTMGRLNEAIDMASQAVEGDKNNALAWQLRGQIYLMMANYEKAISDFDRSKMLSDEPSTRLMEADAYLGKKQQMEAITELKNIIDDPQVGNEARSRLEQIYVRLKRDKELKELYEDCLKKYPDDVFWMLRAGKYALATGSYQTAEQLYTNALKKSTQQGRGTREALNGYLEVLLLTKQFDRLFEESKKYTDSELATVVYVQMADAEKRLGNAAQATKYARLAADKAQNNDAVFYETLRAMFQVIGKDGVIEYCNDKLKENAKSLPANLALYSIYNLNGDYEKAVNMIDKCIELAGDDKNRKIDFNSKKAWALYSQYLKSSDKNFLKKALDVYESLLKDVPKKYSADIMNNVAYMLAASDERLSDAVEYAKQACEIGYNNPQNLDTYAYVLYKSGKYSEADEMIERAIRLFESRQLKISWNVFERQGMIKEKLGARIQASAAYNKALETGGQEIPEADATRLKASIERVSKEDGSTGL